MAYLITGATGFIGRRLVRRLLARGTDDVFLLVRAASRDRLAADLEGLPSVGRVTLLEGDVTADLLGLADRVGELRGRLEHVFHLAAHYDMGDAGPEADARNERLNVDGTRNAVRFAEAVGAGAFHHVSSVAVAGRHPGLFREDMFDEGQQLPTAYHRTKFAAEKVVRDECTVPWRVYRPAVVVGDSTTGEMDKVDGPYYFFPLIKRVRAVLPPWVPLAGPELGRTNIVPVDYVAAALDEIAHIPGLDGQAFHLAHPRGQKAGEVINEFLKAANAPRLALRIDKGLLDALPKGVVNMLMKLPAVASIRDNTLRDLGVPPAVLGEMTFTCTFDTRDTERALKGTGVAVPELASYAAKLWDYWERTLDPDLHKDRSLAAAVAGKRVLITGASSGIGEATALRVAAAGGVPLLVARSADKLEEVRAKVQQAGGEAYVYSCDVADPESVERLVAAVLDEQPQVDFLVNNAGRSIRRSILLSLDRFHDFERTMQLNYFGTIRLIMAFLPHFTEQRRGHVVNVSSIGVQTSPPRFSAYVASKAALDAFTKVVASELLGHGVTFTTIHMPLVRTPMIAPTSIYDSFPTISPDEAADLVCEALRSRPKQINTRLGTAGEVLYALAPRVVDQVLHLAYNVFPDSAAARRHTDGTAEAPRQKASTEAVALAHLLRGVHW